MFYKVLFSTFAVSLLACSTGDGGDRYSNLSSELERNREKWSTADIEDYQITSQRVCFCPPPYTDEVVVTVRDGEVESVFSNREKRQLEDTYNENFDSVDELFQTIEEAIARRADAIEVSYDETLGYPTAVRIDYSYQMADEEFAVEVKGLEQE